MTQAHGPDITSVDSKPPGSAASPFDALAEAQTCWNSYHHAAARSQRGFRVSEVVLLAVCSLIPISGILTPNDARLPAILGAVVVALTGLRSVFHWRDSWLSCEMVCEKIQCEMRLYKAGVHPYGEPNSKDQQLASRLNNIERQEMLHWASLSGPESKTAQYDPPSPARRQ
ncbi:DUF4231 domain-containing protein [Geodermatophilus sp. URMC 63]